MPTWLILFPYLVDILHINHPPLMDGRLGLCTKFNLFFLMQLFDIVVIVKGCNLSP